MERPVKGRPQQLGHAGIDDGEVALGRARLEIDHPRNEDAGRSRDGAAGLDDNGQPCAADFGDECGRIGGGRRHIAAVVRDPETATQIQVLEHHPDARHFVAQASDERRGVPQWIERRDLRSDVHVDRDELQRTACRNGREQLARGVERHAELVDLEARGNVGVAFRVDVRVDSDRDARRAAGPLGDRLDARQLSSRFDVDRLQPERDAALELGCRLADAGEHDFRRLEPGFARHLDFPDRVGVGRAAQAAQQAREGERGVRFQGIVQRVRIGAERRVDADVARSKRGGAIHIEGRAFGKGDCRQWNAVTDELVGDAREADHSSV